MSIRVSSTELKPTHHFSLENRAGEKIGLLACNSVGEPLDLYTDLYVKNPVQNTALKQTSGNSSYDIFDYPYTPIVQDDLSGGRGNLDFERDSTRYFDSFRANSGRQNKAFAGPLEKYVTGHRDLSQSTPGSVDFVRMTDTNRVIYKRFLMGSDLDVEKGWLLVRRKATPGDLTFAIHADSAGNVGGALDSITIAYTRMDDILSEWLNEAITESLSTGTYYWLVITADAEDTDKKHWLVGVKESTGTTYASSTYSSTPSAADYDLYYRLTPADEDKTCIMFEYKEQQYFVISGTSGAPSIFMAGDRGAADSNTGQLSKLIDATKSWSVNEHVGAVVMITDGPGKLEPQPWRTVTSNTSGALTVDEDWTIDHTNTTEYVLISPSVREITGHGLTAPVTSVLVSPKGVIYFCMGDDVTVRRLRAYNNAGAWEDFGHANCQANETAATKAVFMVYKPQAQKFVIANNSDASSNVSCTTSTNYPDWGTALTWGTPLNIDSKYRRITGLACYPDGGGFEAIWIFKTDLPFIMDKDANVYPVSIYEMQTVRSLVNGVNPMQYGVYLYFPMQQGLIKYYGGTFDAVGPNLDEGLPTNRRGPIVKMQSYPGKHFIVVDAGASGYSSIIDSGGWHERYRAPLGQRIRTIGFQVVPGDTPDRMWMYQGNDLLYLPFPSDNTNELQDPNYEYTHEFSIELSRMHAGMFDVQKLVKLIKIQSENLEIDTATGRPICWFELDYKLNADDEWTTVSDLFTESPTESVDFTDVFGLAGKRLKFRIRGYTRDNSKTAVFLAIMVFAVSQIDVKNYYGAFSFIVEDNQKVMGLREQYRDMSAMEQVELLEQFGDASNDSMLKPRSVAALCDDKMVFLNMGARKQIRFKNRKLDGGETQKDAVIVSLSFWEA